VLINDVSRLGRKTIENQHIGLLGADSILIEKNSAQKILSGISLKHSFCSKKLKASYFFPAFRYFSFSHKYTTRQIIPVNEIMKNRKN